MGNSCVTHVFFAIFNSGNLRILVHFHDIILYLVHLGLLKFPISLHLCYFFPPLIVVDHIVQDAIGLTESVHGVKYVI